MWDLLGNKLTSRLILGTALYPSLQCMRDAIRVSETEVITVSLSRQNPSNQAGLDFWNYLRESGCRFLPNTAGCRRAEDACYMAAMAREIFNTHWIKLEVIGDDYLLSPDPFELLKACELLIKDGFEVFPFCTDDLVLCQRLVDLGCRVIMPWASPIGSGKGLINPYALEVLRERLPDTIIIVDAGIGKPSHAVQALELGMDAVLLNTAVAEAQDPIIMATAFRDAIRAGRMAYDAGMMLERNVAQPSTALIDTPFWHQEPSSEDSHA